MVQSPNKYANIFKNNNIYLLFHIETPTLIWMTKKKTLQKTISSDPAAHHELLFLPFCSFLLFY